jgi:hypothetical protein
MVDPLGEMAHVKNPVEEVWKADNPNGTVNQYNYFASSALSGSWECATASGAKCRSPCFASVGIGITPPFRIAD